MVSINHIRADTYPGQPPTARLISCQDQDLAMMNSGLFHKHSHGPAASHDSNPHGQLHSLCELFLRFIEAAPRVPWPAHCGAAGGACKPSAADHISPEAVLPFLMQI